MDAKDADTDPVDETDEHRGHEGDREAGPQTWPWTNVATTKPAIDATAPTERSMPPVSIVSVWQPARMARGTAAWTMTPDQRR